GSPSSPTRTATGGPSSRSSVRPDAPRRGSGARVDAGAMTTETPGAQRSGPRPVRAPRGTELSTRGWQQEAVLRMLMNNLDPEVAEDPDHLVVDGGTRASARTLM